MVLPRVLLITATVVACAPKRPDCVTPCNTDAHIYTLADTVRGVRPAYLRHLRSPINSAFSSVQVLVTARGVALPESTKVAVVYPPTAERSTRQAFEQAEYIPATLRGCAVNFWLEVGVMAVDNKG